MASTLGNGLEGTFIDVGAAGDLASGERAFVESQGVSVVIFNIAGQFFAIEDRCSHDDGPLGDGLLEDHKVICPRHGAEFDVRNGAALTMPAVLPVLSYEVRVEQGRLLLAVRASES